MYSFNDLNKHKLEGKVSTKHYTLKLINANLDSYTKCSYGQR